MFKTRLIALAILGAGAFGITAAPATALTAAPQPAVQQGDANPNLIEVNNHRRDARRELRRDRNRDRVLRYDSRRHGPRCSRWSNNCRHFYRGYYYSSPWWTLPFVGAGIVIGNNYAVRGYSSRHVQWCRDRYRSYNVRTNTWVSYSGEVRQCRSPFR